MTGKVTVLVLIALSVQVLPVALGIDPKKGFISFGYSLILLMSQLLFLYVGLLLGNRFLHLLENYKEIVIFMGLFLIGVRMIMDAFKIRKGERTYLLDNTTTLIMASVAQGINTLLAGLILSYISITISQLIFVLLISTFIVTVLGVLLKAKKYSYALSALLYSFSGMIMLVSSVYLGFFN